MTARHAALEPWWHTYTTADADRAHGLLEAHGVGWAADRAFGTLSTGERQRVLLARALMGDAGLVLMDEPAAGLDLGGREALVDHLDALAADRAAPPIVLVTHHVEEIPPSFTHVMALRSGEVVGCGPLPDTLDDRLLSRCFDLAITVDHRDGRFTAPSSPFRHPRSAGLKGSTRPRRGPAVERSRDGSLGSDPPEDGRRHGGGRRPPRRTRDLRRRARRSRPGRRSGIDVMGDQRRHRRDRGRRFRGHRHGGAAPVGDGRGVHAVLLSHPTAPAGPQHARLRAAHHVRIDSGRDRGHRTGEADPHPRRWRPARRPGVPGRSTPSSSRGSTPAFRGRS